jgi:competence protein ComEC
MFLASAAAEAALLPVSASVFERVTFAGLALNCAAIPLMAVAQLAGMLVVPLAAVSARLAALIGWVASIGAEGLVRSAELVRFAPALTWRVAAPSAGAIVCYYTSTLSAWWLWRRRIDPLADRRRRIAARLTCRAPIAFALLSAFWIAAEPWRWRAAAGDGRLHVTFVDVGQGDAAFVRLPRGEAVVVDAGGLSAASSFDVGDRVVAPVLRQAGVGGLIVLALTHGDGDHIGGAGTVIDEFKPRDIWEGIPVPSFEPLRTLRTNAQRVRSRWTTVQTGDSTAIDDVEIAVRHPGRPDWERQKVRNDDSIVLELLWRDVSVVLTGDIGREVEQQIAPQFARVPLRIVKVPHHGSLTSSSEPFVRALSPRVAVVSVGRSNPFGHPAPAVLDRYRSAGAEVFRTDRDGAVTIDTDGYSLSVHTFTGKTQFMSR